MIYLIDDNIGRQEGYGWTKEKVHQYDDVLYLIKNEKELKDSQASILSNGNVVLFHESFMLSTDEKISNVIESFKKALNEMGNSIHVAIFSGSKPSRFVEKFGHTCMLPADVLYENLETFLYKASDNEIDFRYLAYGNNYQIEEDLRNRIISINDEDFNKEKVATNFNTFFASVSNDELAVVPPFNRADHVRDWDIQFDKTNISDIKLDELVHNWFGTKKYDRIYIPLCFGVVLSDFVGLRLAMHIRLTDTPNKEVPIFIYGEASTNDICINECFDILKTNGVSYISGSYNSLLDSLNVVSPVIHWEHELSKICVNTPSNIGDNHSVANRWAISRWNSMFDWKGNPPLILEDALKSSLYLKYLESKSGIHQKFNKKSRTSVPISEIEGKKIVYIDDEYDKGWNSLLSRIFADSKADFRCFKGFDKGFTREELIQVIKEFVDGNDADCYIVDLRLHESDFEDNAHLSGHDVAEYIKRQNRGNQIVVFTASNKVWNLKEEVNNIGALDYVLKESPEMNLNRDASKRLFVDFARAVKLACKMSYLKDLVNRQKANKETFPYSASLDSIIELLQRDQNNKNQDLLGTAFLSEMVFIEDFFKSQLGLSISIESEGTCSERCELFRKKTNERFLLSGRIFIKRESRNGHPVVTEITDYNDAVIDTPDGLSSTIKESDVTIVACGMIVYLGISYKIANDYIKYKAIRNEIAHQSKSDRTLIMPSDVILLYNQVITPVIHSGASRL